MKKELCYCCKTEDPWIQRSKNTLVKCKSCGAKKWPMTLTVKDLKEKLKNYPDDAVIYYQRIEDSYFEEENNGWNPILKQSEYLYRMTEEEKEKHPEYAFDQFIGASQIVKYPDDENLFIWAHY